MKEVSEFLPDVLKSANENSELLEGLIFARWNRVVGHGIAEHSIPLHFHQGILTVAVPTEAWKKQLESMRGIVIGKINAQLKQRKLEQVEFVMKSNNENFSRKKANRKPTSSSVAENAVHNTIEQAVEIRDEELRELFTRIAVQNLNLQDSKKTKR